MNFNALAIIMFSVSAITISALRKPRILRPASIISNQHFATSSASAAAGSKTFILEYNYVENMAERRAPHRAAHLAYANQYVQ